MSWTRKQIDEMRSKYTDFVIKSLPKEGALREILDKIDQHVVVGPLKEFIYECVCLIDLVTPTKAAWGGKESYYADFNVLSKTAISNRVITGLTLIETNLMTTAEFFEEVIWKNYTKFISSTKDGHIINHKPV